MFVKNLTELISVDIFLETSNNLNVCGSFKYFEQKLARFILDLQISYQQEKIEKLLRVF